jgi:putative ABC transport system permease protein
MGIFWKDLQVAIRMLAKKPGFIAVAVITLALGISINATMFSMVSAFLLRRPPGRDPDRVAVISSIDPAQGFQAEASLISMPNYLAWRDANHVFADVAATDEYRNVSLTTQGQSEAFHAAAASSNYFGVLGVAPQLGRTFAAGEDQPGRDHVVVLSHELWTSHYGSDASIIGRTIRLNREDYTVIGVMPTSFQMMGYTAQLWIPLVSTPADQTVAAHKDRNLHLFARLKPGVTIQQARAEVVTLAGRAQENFPEVEKGWGATVRTLPDFLIYDFGIRTALAVLMTTVGFVLLIACANVAGLLLARAAGRRKELAIRFALGAGRMRIVRQLLTEGLVIALLGGGVGLMLASWGIKVVRAHMAFNDAVSAVPVTLDRNVMLFAAGISLVCAVLCSLAPSLNASRTDITTNLKDESRTASASRSHSRLRSVMVTGEIAMALFLLVGTGLLVRGIYSIERQNLGFRADHLLTANVTLDEAHYKDASQQVRFVKDVMPRLQHLPGAELAAVASDLPASGAGTVTLRIKGRPDSPTPNSPTNERFTALDFVVTPEFFQTSGIALLRGRTFTGADSAAKPRVVMVNQDFADRYFHGEEPLGKQIQLDVSGEPVWSEIVGIVGNVKVYSGSSRDAPEVYESFFQRPVNSFSLIVRAASDPAALSSALRGAVAQADADLPLSHVMSMPAVIDRQRGGDSFFVRVLAVFALLALILAAIGIYGLIAYSVGQRTHEIGIRIALGARGQDVLRMIVGEGMKIAAIGGAIGLVIALPLPRLFAAIFFDLRVHEPQLYFIVPLVVFAVAVLAAYIPARRAARVDPMNALRQE